MTTRMAELVRRTGLSRQWISRLAALGQVPGARRRSSGRWHFWNSAALENWIKQMGRRTRIRIRRRFLHQDEAEVRRLHRKIANLRTTPLARNARARLLQLTAE